jgi:K+/H+ antiporter YhaU regulatory subunit KhtT
MNDSKEVADTTPIYLGIALDISRRIAGGELPEGTKLYGRSIMSSEYGVSPETIRRSLKLLSDMNVVVVHHNSGAVVLSKENAKAYLARFDEYAGVQALRKKLKAAIADHATLTKQIYELVNDISGITVRVSPTNPFQNYEIDVPKDSPIVGKTLEELNFWQETGATVIAIKRKAQVFLSPGPYIRFEADDRIIFIGEERSIHAIQSFISAQN